MAKLGGHTGLSTPQAVAQANNAKEQSAAITTKNQLSKEEQRRKTFMEDVKAGQEFGKEAVPEGSLGRLSTESLQKDVSALASRIGQGTAAQSRRLAAMQARSGLRGGAAGAQQMELAARGQEALTTGITEKALDVERFNLDQAARERFTELSSGLSFAQLGTIERSAETAASAQAAAAAAQSGGGGPTVICSELYRQGLMDEEIYGYDYMYGAALFKKSPETILGYHKLALPVVDLMSKSALFTHFINLFAKPWSIYMASTINTSIKASLFGKCIDVFGRTVCKFVGKIMLGVSHAFNR
jgi:hypothetical protein